MPTDYFKGMSSIQCRTGIKAVSQLEDILLRRKQNALKVHQWLIKNEKNRIPDDLLQQHAFLKYPLMVKNRDQFLQIAENNRLPMGDWFISPLHPIKESLLPWGLDTGKLPNATAISQKIVNLPLDGPVSRLINFLELYKKEIE
jgi:dTDP-4-amino-4,6-dideoxygalactose transaminase